MNQFTKRIYNPYTGRTIVYTLSVCKLPQDNTNEEKIEQ